jgi:hypothetical protein
LLKFGRINIFQIHSLSYLEIFQTVRLQGFPK